MSSRFTQRIMDSTSMLVIELTRTMPVYVAPREQRQSKVKTPLARQDAAPSDSPVADLVDSVAMQTVPKVKVPCEGLNIWV